MRQKLHQVWSRVAVLLAATTLFVLNSSAQNKIRMTTASPVDSEIKLAIRANGNLTFKGLSGNWGPNFNDVEKRVRYTVTNQEIVIEGDIIEIDCHKVKLTSIDVTECPNLETLICYENDIDLINVSKNPKLKKIDFAKNARIAEVDFQKNPLLEKLECDDTQLTKLDVSKNPKMIRLHASKCKIEALDLTNCPNLEALWIDFNNLKELTLKDKAKLHTVWCDANQIQTLSVDNCPVLRLFGCNNNRLESLTFKQSPAIEKLWCQGNKLTELDVTSLGNLVLFYCQQNNLTKLDISKNTKLMRFWLYGNRIEGAAMSQLVEGLPNLEGKNLVYDKYDGDGAFVVVNNKIKEAQNLCSTADVAVVEKKFWIAYDYNGDFPNRVIYAGGPVSVEAIMAQGAMKVAAQPGGFELMGAPELALVKVYTTEGMLCATATTDADGYARVTLLQAPQGLYIIHVGNQVCKVVF